MLGNVEDGDSLHFYIDTLNSICSFLSTLFPPFNKIYLEYPELESLRFNYRPDLSHHAQALVDLKKFKQKCVLRDRITEEKIAEFENNKKLGKKHNYTKPDVEGKRLKEQSKQGTLMHESTSKPRALLTTFVRASQSDDKENKNEGYPNGDAVDNSKISKSKYSKTAFLTDDWTHHSEKKVRWQQDDLKLSDVNKMTKRTEAQKGTETAFSSMQKAKGSLKRQSFGSSNKPKNSDIRDKYDLKHASGTKEKVLMPASRLSISNPLSNAKAPATGKHITSALKVPKIREKYDVGTKEKVTAPSSRSSTSNPLSITKAPTASKHISSALKVPSVSMDSKKRTSSSRQSSGISSQERSSKLGRRRKRSSQSGGASVGSKSIGRRDFDDEEYNFNFNFTKL